MRQVVLDTETTGLKLEDGHRVVEIGCVELINGKSTGICYNTYLNPERQVEDAAFKIHGLSDQFLQDKPLFTDTASAFLNFIDGAVLIVHNAEFDVKFLNAELNAAGYATLEQYCKIVDTLPFAREIFPGQSNKLEDLCKRFKIDDSVRVRHGALIDAQLLAQVYWQLSGNNKNPLLFNRRPLTFSHKPAETHTTMDKDGFDRPKPFP